METVEFGGIKIHFANYCPDCGRPSQPDAIHVCGQFDVPLSVSVEPQRFRALSQVILFDEEKPALGWISSTQPLSTFMDGTPHIFVALSLEDAKAGRGEWIPIRHVRSYDEDLWAACELWISRYRQLCEDRWQLRRGDISGVQSSLEDR